jgi:hypothetical protein
MSAMDIDKPLDEVRVQSYIREFSLMRPRSLRRSPGLEGEVEVDLVVGPALLELPALDMQVQLHGLLLLRLPRDL